MHARITVHDEALLADTTGALFWADQKLLMVADLHFGKGASFARRGQFLPPYDTRATLDLLGQALRRYRPARVACIGDSFHDRDAADTLDDTDRDRLKRMVVAHDWTWIVGNHDPNPSHDLGGKIVDELRLGRLVLRHQPVEPHEAAGEICGHLHPKATVAARGRHIAAPCFATDGRRMVMPAFGAYTGGLDVRAPAIAQLFGRNFRVLLLGRERLFLFPRDRLA